MYISVKEMFLKKTAIIIWSYAYKDFKCFPIYSFYELHVSFPVPAATATTSAQMTTQAAATPSTSAGTYEIY